jgi:hypothetical protein
MAWHAVFLFLKSMESLEDFRKNSHVQIPSKSPCTKFQSLTNSKNQFKIRKEILPLFQPEQPNWPGPPFWPRSPGRPGHLHSSWASTSQPAWPTPSPPFSFPSSPPLQPRDRASARRHPVYPFSSPKRTPPPSLPLRFPHHCPRPLFMAETEMAPFKTQHRSSSHHFPTLRPL